MQACFIKMGDTKTLRMIFLSKNIREVLFNKKLTVTVKYLTSVLITQASLESSHKTEFYGGKINVSVFQKNYAKMETPWIDLFVSWISHQLSICAVSKQDHYSMVINKFSITWNKGSYYESPSFYLISQILSQVDKDMTEKLILICPCWQTQFWYPES